MRRLLFLPLGLVPTALVLVTPATVGRAETQPTMCATYEVDGGIAFGLAEVTVTAVGEPLPGREVFAVFDDATGAPLGDPALLVTDEDGRAVLPVPDGASGVEFVVEAPPTDCQGEPDLVSVTRVIPPTADMGAIAADAPAADMGADREIPITEPGNTLGVPGIVGVVPETSLIVPEIFETSAGPLELVAVESVGPDPTPVDEPLPHTGRASELLLTGGLLAFALGWWIRDWCRQRSCRTGGIRR